MNRIDRITTIILLTFIFASSGCIDINDILKNSQFTNLIGSSNSVAISNNSQNNVETSPSTSTYGNTNLLKFPLEIDFSPINLTEINCTLWNENDILLATIGIINKEKTLPVEVSLYPVGIPINHINISVKVEDTEYNYTYNWSTLLLPYKTLIAKVYIDKNVGIEGERVLFYYLFLDEPFYFVVNNQTVIDEKSYDVELTVSKIDNNYLKFTFNVPLNSKQLQLFISGVKDCVATQDIIEYTRTDYSEPQLEYLEIKVGGNEPALICREINKWINLVGVVSWYTSIGKQELEFTNCKGSVVEYKDVSIYINAILVNATKLLCSVGRLFGIYNETLCENEK